ncbi:sodium:solute symporter family protein [Metabacillus sediminilitoris]|uniref:Sodium:solute symporter family protein n=1 Tax=Metabacillus sediminilitoris TaxID=2567941 RepID=A0A4S4BUP2_9BACI|nr:sodium:solute symporter family protein [Metabacillus sediminilitoris]QGQ45587.1 sodium:solute symporter family protein [Metabacillus sediminilitoris]THF76651.1 sodium:solute symporter family protein [Metabacillus sediminilitoris]
MNAALLVILFFLVLCIWLGLQARKGKEMTMEQWSVGGRGFGSVLMFFLLAGEMFTTYTFLGASGGTYRSGIPAALYAFNCFYFVIAYWLLPPIWKYAKKNNVISQSDLYEKKYNSQALGILVAIISVIAIIPYLVMQLKGLGIIVSQASYGSISPNMAIVVGVIAITIYVSASGMHGAAWTAIIKDILILAVVVFMGIYFPLHYYGGVQPMFEAINEAKNEFLIFPEQGLSISWFVSATIMTALAFYMFPHMLAGVFSAKSAKSLRLNAGVMPIYQIIIVFSLLIGFSAIIQVPDLNGADADLALFKMAKMSFDPWFVGVIGAAGAMAALIPSSLVLTATATILSKNIYKVWKPNTTDQQLTKLSRMLVPVIALVTLYFTFNGGDSIFTLYLMSYSFMVQLFPALFFSLWKRNPATVQGAFAGMIAGIIIVFYSTVTETSLATLFPSLPQEIKDIDLGLAVIIINIVVTLGVSAVTRKSVNRVEEEADISHIAR